jgi:hypothetical protein
MNQTELLAGLPAFRPIDQIGWTKLLRDCRKASLQKQNVVTYLWRLGCLVQAEMDEGSSFEQVITDCIDDADANRSIGSVEFDTAVGILAAHWVHGEQLLIWYRHRCSLN